MCLGLGFYWKYPARISEICKKSIGSALGAEQEGSKNKRKIPCLCREPTSKRDTFHRDTLEKRQKDACRLSSSSPEENTHSPDYCASGTDHFCCTLVCSWASRFLPWNTVTLSVLLTRLNCWCSLLFLVFLLQAFPEKYLIFHMKIKVLIYYYICGILKTLLVFYV